MAIETSLQPRQTRLYLIYAVLCVAFALWGAYDYWVSIPRREAAVARYSDASEVFSRLQDRASAHQSAPSAAPPLTDAEQAQLLAAQETLAEFRNEKPEPPAGYDRAVQVWLYMVGCGVLGAPWCLWAWFSMRNKRFRLDDDGTLHYPGGSIAPEDMKDIDMSRWMAKSIATVHGDDGRAIKLDDYKYRNMHLIVGAIAQRFHPEDWTEDARDRRKMEAEAAEAAAAAAPMEDVGEDSTHQIMQGDRNDGTGESR